MDPNTTFQQPSDLDIICFGEPLLEINEQPDGERVFGFGGDTSNCAISAARCGARTGVLAQLGDDAHGQQFLSLWQREGVSTQGVRVLPNTVTGSYTVTHDDEGHHFSYAREGSAASLITSQDVPTEHIAKSRYLHVSGISQAISASAEAAVFTAIETARNANVTVSYDTNLRLKLWSLERARAVIKEATSLSQIVLPGFDDAVQLTQKKHPDDIVDYYLNNGSSLVALTLGAKGVLVATPDNREQIPPFSVNVIDATGAGDTFDGAFLSQLVNQADAFSAARFANAAGALSTTSIGAVNSMPTKSEVEQYLQRHSSSTKK